MVSNKGRFYGPEVISTDFAQFPYPCFEDPRSMRDCDEIVMILRRGRRVGYKQLLHGGSNIDWITRDADTI